MRESSERTVAFQLTDNIVKPHFQSLGIKEHFQTWRLIILVTVIIDIFEMADARFMEFWKIKKRVHI